MKKEVFKQKVVSKKSAKVLRAIGHDSFCDCYYHTDNDDPWDYEMGNNQVCNSTFEDYHERIAAPYVTDALIWLIQNKGIAFDVISGKAKTETGLEYLVTLKWGFRHQIGAKEEDFQDALCAAIEMLLTDQEFVESE